jgi:DNA-binding transcriptional MocR family regulator
MTSWQPDLSQFSGPRYLAIALSLGEAVAKGHLKAGDRLPTHRDLAHRLGVTVPTVSRAYREAERRGLTSGEVGRGTYVRPMGTPSKRDLREASTQIRRLATAAAQNPFALTPAADTGPIDFEINRPAVEGPHSSALAQTLAEIAASPALVSLLNYQPHVGAPNHRAAGATWINRSQLPATPDRVIVTCGGKHSMLVALAAVAKSGDVVVTEALSWPGIKTVAAFLGFSLKAVALDEHGIIPASFEASCRSFRPKALYCTPTAQNPTTAVMPEARRREIVDIARAHDVAIVEDEVYGPLVDSAPVTLAALAPERGFYLTSLSKALAPGLRIGYVLAPVAKVAAVASGVRATTIMASPLLAEVGARWIGDGTVERLIAWQRDEVKARLDILKIVLAGHSVRSTPYAMHAWLELPQPWTAAELVEDARRRGVSLSTTQTFVVEGETPAAVRLALCGPSTQQRLEQGLVATADILASGSRQGMMLV